MENSENTPKLHILLAATVSLDELNTGLRQSVFDRLSTLPNVLVKSLQIPSVTSHRTLDDACPRVADADSLQAWKRKADADEAEVSSLCAWSDFLVLFPIDADSLARMLHGLTDNTLLKVLRSWDVTKKILLVPGMSTLMWENPMTKKQLTKIRRKWNWVRVIEPVLWIYENGSKRKVLHWGGMEEFVESVRTQVDLLTIGHDVNVTAWQTSITPSKGNKGRGLPPELWSMILDFTGDWELATALNVHTSVPTPPEWRNAASEVGPQTLIERLEWALLTGSLEDVKALVEQHAPVRWLSRLCIKLTMRFGNVGLLSYLEANHKDLFWDTFGHTFLPDKASSVFGRVELLEFWRTSPSFLNKEYTAETLDGASRAGFVNVLNWWYKSGLQFKFTEAAMEQASTQGHIDVLEWWKNAATADQNGEMNRVYIRPKPGKSIAYATQSGSLPVLRWWATSGIPFPHEDTVAKLASTHGHTNLLSYWQSLRGEKMIFDNQVLVGATKMGHRDVLEWWKRSGLRVEYKTCDIEEALEDGDEGPRGESVKRWWARNGLNLGVGTSEWMMTKVLGV